MNNYHSYRPAQVDPYMPPYYSEYSGHPQDHGARPRPMPLPLSFKRSWRDRFSMVIGLAIISLAIATLFLGGPEQYIENAILPKHVVSPERWEKLFNFSETKQPSRRSSMEVEQEQEEIIQEDIKTSSGARDTEIEIIEKSRQTRTRPQAQGKRASRTMVLNSAYVVQIIAERDYTSAERYYYNLLAQHGDLFKPLRFTVEPVDLGPRGTFYRLYVLPFANQKRANNLCVALKQRGEDCLVRKR